jgi:hypothetical protein
MTRKLPPVCTATTASGKPCRNTAAHEIRTRTGYRFVCHQHFLTHNKGTKP